jgi:hypothetical protein
MSDKLEDWEIEDEYRLIEEEEANARFVAISAEDWFTHASDGFEQVEKDVLALVRIGYPRPILLRELRELNGLSGITLPRSLTAGIARRTRALADELGGCGMPKEAWQLADPLLSGAKAIAGYEHERSKRRQQLKASITRRVDGQIRPRGRVGKEAQHAILARLFAWATETPRTVHAQRVATSRLAKKFGSTARFKSGTPVATPMRRKRSQKSAVDDSNWQDGPGGFSRKKAREVVDHRNQGLRVTSRTH